MRKPRIITAPKRSRQMDIIKRNGRSYYLCRDCGCKFVHLHKVDDHGCKYKAEETK